MKRQRFLLLFVPPLGGGMEICVKNSLQIVAVEFEKREGSWEDEVYKDAWMWK